MEIESIAGVVALIFTAIFVYSFFDSFDIISIILDYTIPKHVIQKTRIVLGVLAGITTLIYLVLVIMSK